MKNPEGNIGDVYFGEKAEEALFKANKKPENGVKKPDLANEWVDNKLAENTIVPGLDGDMTYGDLFKETSELPPEINSPGKFMNWRIAENNKRKAA